MQEIKKLIGFIVASKVRMKVLKTLNKYAPIRQTELAKKVKQKQQNVSKVLMDLEKEGLVECLTPDKKAWKVYDITELGKEIVKILKN